MQTEAYHIAKCKELIEQKLGWGKYETWQSHDFDRLSDRLFMETQVMLSSSTLKRIWGKVRYNSTPNRSTLDALARFIGFENWRAFTSSFPGEVEDDQKEIILQVVTESKPVTTVASKRPYGFRKLYKTLFIIIVFASLILFVALKLRKPGDGGIRYSDIRFSSRVVSSGLPNTVIFNYDASRSNADSVFIQQSWDLRKRYLVNKQLHEYASTYYYPGFYKAKLILNDSIVSEHDVYIETNGWVGIVEKDPLPVYLPSSLFKRQLALTKENLSELKIDFQQTAPVFTLTRVDKNGAIDGNNLIVDVLLQNTYDESNGICKFTQVLVMGTNSVICIPLCKPGCVGEIGLMLGTHYKDGKTHDLSGFGVNFSQCVKLHCETRNKQITIALNDKLIYSGELKDEIGKIVGAQIKFSGTGVVHHFNMKSGSL